MERIFDDVYDQKRKKRNEYMREYMRKKNEKIRKQIQQPTYVFPLDNALLEFDLESLANFFQRLYEVYKQHVGHTVGEYLRNKEDIRDYFTNSILFILNGGKEVARILTPYGVIPNIEEENNISAESERKYNVKKEEGGLGDINLELNKQNIENEDSDEIYDTEDDTEQNVQHVLEKETQPVKFSDNFKKRWYPEWKI